MRSVTGLQYFNRVLASIAAVLLLVSTTAVAHAQPAAYKGRPLAEAIQTLQAGGLRIVFSSETVTPDMRVLAEPRAKLPRQVLDELLKPHHLKAENGPGGVIQVVRAESARAVDAPKPRTRTRPVAVERAHATGAYREHVTVTAPRLLRQDPGVSSASSLGRDDLQNLRDVFADDPIRAMQGLPHVAAGDDFRSEFSVRGSPYRQIGVVVDGVATRWLRHAVYGGGNTGSLAMLNSLVIEQATLQSGAYPRRYGDRLGAQLDLSLREGSRTGTAWRGAVGGTSATLAGEGPLGSSERGSWLVAARQSYREWPNRLFREYSGKAFGFTDAQAKLVYDVRPGQQVSATFLGGRSNVDERGNGAPGDLALGTNDATLLNVSWRSALASDTVLTERVSLVTHRFLNTNQMNRESARGTDHELSYRADLRRAMFGGLLEAGGQAQRMRGSRDVPQYGESIGGGVPQLQSVDGFDGSSWLRSGYVHFKWMVTPTLTVAPGLRVDDATLIHRRTVARWVLSEWTFRPGWTLNATAGVSHQLPELDQLLGVTGAPNLRPERAAQVDVGIEQRVSRSIRWEARLFTRDERDVLRDPPFDEAHGGPEFIEGPDVNPMLVGGILAVSPGLARYENALSGSSRGVELLLDRTSTTRFSGWIAYSYGKTRQTDAARHETFWADFDQRHGLNASGLYRHSDRTSVAIKFRGGTNFPVPGYLTVRDGALFAGSRRNEVRLPAYARLDVRANRTFDYPRHRLTLFVEVLNVLNRSNLGVAHGFIRRGTGEAAGFTEKLFPRVPSAGILIEF